MSIGADPGPTGYKFPVLSARVTVDGVEDLVAVEEPLEIRVGGSPLAVTMRTPGHDDELAAGFLVSEGLVVAADIRAIGPPADLAGGIVEVDATLRRRPPERRFYATSSCGVCGKGALEEVEVLSDPLPPPSAGGRPSRELLAALPDRLEQPAFDATGGMHATGLFTHDGRLLLAREDVGRHNAMDKVIGRCALDGALPLHDRILCVSGRLSFELVQKAAVAGAPVLVGVGAPTSLAVRLAAERGMALAGFARRGRVNVYAGADRLA